MRLVLSALCACVCVACSSKVPGEGALHVVVTLDAGLASKCARVEVTPDTGAAKRTGAMVLDSRLEPLHVAVVKDGSLTGHVTVQALGYSDPACETRTSPVEESERADATFVLGQVTNVTVDLHKATSVPPVDADNDGVTALTDCDDHDASRYPGNAESCRDSTDNDCDTLVDCADPACDTRGCGPMSVPTPGVCASGLCVETSCADGLDNNGLRGVDCLDPDCAGLGCPLGGVCVSGVCVAPVEVCTDLVDNDGDSLVDCADTADCSGNGCNDQNPCTSGESCQGTSCVDGGVRSCTTALACFVSQGSCDVATGECVFTADAGASCEDGRACTVDLCLADGGCGGTLSCFSPPGQCYAAAGSCDADGGCAYPVRAGACDDGKACTASDACQGDGTCQGAVECASPPGQCFADAGTCGTGGACDYPVRSGSCDDGDNCTTGEVCQADGGCAAGTPVTCTPPECQAFTGCATGAVCEYGPSSGGACDGGWGICASGGCVQFQPAFPFQPSNFTQHQVPATDGGVVLNPGCNLTVNTRTSDGGYSITGSGCTVSPVPFAVVPQDGGPDALLLAMDTLTVTHVMTVVGARPLILAVKGVANITQEIRLTGSGSTPGAGGGLSSHCAGATNNGSGDPGGGGSGGAFGDSSGAGGDNPSGGGGAVAGSAVGSADLVPLRGGCNGGSGGKSGGGGGVAGGGVQITAATSISVSGRIAAGGDGGNGASFTARGGGGGGSGGAILLEAPSVTVAGGLFANGGGGAEGSSGLSGSDGQPATLTSAAQSNGSSNFSGCGGNGREGGSRGGGAVAGNAGVNGCLGNHGGGGGGGGSVGRIRIRGLSTCTLAGQVSPAPVTTGSTGC